MNVQKGAQSSSRLRSDKMSVKVIKWDDLDESVRASLLAMAAKPGHKNAAQFVRMAFCHLPIISVRLENPSIPRLSITVEGADNIVYLSYIGYERLMRIVRSLEPVSGLSSAAEA